MRLTTLIQGESMPSIANLEERKRQERGRLSFGPKIPRVRAPHAAESLRDLVMMPRKARKGNEAPEFFSLDIFLRT